MSRTVRFSLRDKFLVSFLGLAIVLTGMLALLASKVNQVLPEIGTRQSQRYQAQLVLRDMRESLLEQSIPANIDAIFEDQLVASLREYEDSYSINVSPDVYQALVTENQSSLIQTEQQHLVSIHRNMQLYESTRDNNALVARAALERIIDQTAELEKVNAEIINVLEAAEMTKQRYLRTFFLISIAILLLGITIFAQILASWIMQPIHKIQEAAVRIAGGDLSHQLTADTHDELGVLMESFDDMRRKVLASLSEVRAFAQRDDMLINSIVDMIIAVDEQETIILFNGAAEQTLGCKAADAVGKKLSEIFTFPNAGAAGEERELIGHVISSGQARSLLKPIEIQAIKIDHKVPVTMSVAPFVEGDGKRGAVLVLRDVSENIELDKLREEFVSIASHQLRTPLTAIRWLLEVLIRGEGESKINMDGKHRDTLHQAYARTLSMSELVSSLLALSRVDAQKVSAKLAPIAMPEMFEKTKLNLGSAAERKKIALNFVCDITQKIMSDEVIFLQVLINIVSNAIKYSREGTSVDVHAYAKDKNLLIDVVDHGIGIPPDQQPSIFKKFFRAKNALSFTPEGTGIGLYMVKSFAQLLGGDVAFISTENVGTTFTITLPLQYAQ